MAHPVSLKRACHNVIDNALKYGVIARVQLFIEDATVRISLYDTGPGIEEHWAPDDVARTRRPEADAWYFKTACGIETAVHRKDIV